MKIEYRGFTIEIEQDEYPTDPRELCNLGTMYCIHRRYNLGDINNLPADEIVEIAESVQKSGGVVLPLYLYDHSGLSISTRPYSCQWDSGQVGFIMAEAEKIRSEYSIKRVSKKVRGRAEQLLKSEVEEYGNYLSGNCWGYFIRDKAGNVIDSRLGHLGDPDDCGAIEAAKEVCDWIKNKELKKRLSELKKLIKNRVPLSVRPGKLEAI